MATYAELAAIEDDPQYNTLRQKIGVASAIKAAAIIDSATPGAEALAWAKSAVAKPLQAGEGLIYYVIASNAGAAVSVIYSASDTAIQAKVNDAVDSIYGV